MLAATLDGFLLGGSLIIAIGAQNAFVIRQGILGHFIFWICLFCAVSDTMLICVGVFGLSLLSNALPLFIPIMIYGGASFLAWFGISAMARAIKPTIIPIEAVKAPALQSALLICAGFTFLNPHVYLDTVILVGSVASKQPMDMRGYFALGASTASFLWFFGLGLGAKTLQPWLNKPIVWRVIDGTIALIMAWLSMKLLLS